MMTTKKIDRDLENGPVAHVVVPRTTLGSVSRASMILETHGTVPEAQDDSHAAGDMMAGAFHQEARPGVPAFYAFIPQRTPALEHENGAIPLAVSVHGMSRDAREHLELLMPMAQSRGYALLVPHFDSATYSDYQRLGRRGHGPRADLALFEARSSFEKITDRRFDSLSLMGFSGGSQFVHRFVMAHPREVSAAVCASAGWYSFPDPRLRYPRGLRVGGVLSGIQLNPEAFLRVPLLVSVGAKDTIRDDSIRLNRRLDEMQGANRLERAHNWSRAMGIAAENRGLANLTTCVEFGGAGHSFSECVENGLDQLAFDFFDSARERSVE